MKNKQLINEVKRFQEIAGIKQEAHTPSHRGSDSVSEFEFDLEGKEYIADLEVIFGFDWDREDGMYNYEQEVEIKELGVGQGDEYVPVTDQSEISRVQSLLNSDPVLSRKIEDLIDTWDAEEDFDDSPADWMDEDSDYDMGTSSGDTDAMNIG